MQSFSLFHMIFTGLCLPFLLLLIQHLSDPIVFNLSIFIMKFIQVVSRWQHEKPWNVIMVLVVLHQSVNLFLKLFLRKECLDKGVIGISIVNDIDVPNILRVYVIRDKLVNVSFKIIIFTGWIFCMQLFLGHAMEVKGSEYCGSLVVFITLEVFDALKKLLCLQTLVHYIL